MTKVLKNITWEVINDYVERGLLLTNKHPELDLWILNYSRTCQFENVWDEVTLACRGLVVDAEGNIVARPFTKFFNMEEHTPDEIPTNLSYEVFDKMDGSLGIAFNYNGSWIMATRGSFVSDQAIKAAMMINDSVDYVHGAATFDPNYTYLFEIIYPENRIVVNYGDEEKLVMLGVINNKTGEELSWEEMVNKYGYFFEVVQRHSSENLKDLKNKNLENHEGFVILFENGFRIKVKFEEYVRLHKILTNITARSIWEALSNDIGLKDIVENVPDEFYDWVRKTEKELKDSYKSIELDALKTYAGIVRNVMNGTGVKLTIDNKHEYKKAFALQAVNYKYPSLLFGIYDGKDISGKIWKILKPSAEKPFIGEEE